MRPDKIYTTPQTLEEEAKEAHRPTFQKERDEPDPREDDEDRRSQGGFWG